MASARTGAAATALGNKRGLGKKGNGKKAGGAKSAWVQGLVLGALAVAAPGLAVLAAVLLLPGLIAVVAAGPGWRAQARALLLAGLALSLGPMVGLWRNGAGIRAALALLGQGSTLPLAWGAAGVAWLLAEAVPLLLAAAMEARVAADLTKVRDEHAALAADWTAPEAAAASGGAASGGASDLGVAI